MSNGFTINGWNKRAWTFQEVAVAQEVDFMGMLGTPKELYEFCVATAWSELVTQIKLPDEIAQPLIFSYKVANKSNHEAYAFSLGLTFSERDAFFPEDMLYAILPVIDATVVGKTYLEMWQQVREKFQKDLIKYMRSSKDNGTPPVGILCTNPVWFGMTNPKVIEKVSKTHKTRALVKNGKAFINWNLHGTEFTLKFPTTMVDGQCPVPKNLDFTEGHMDETEEWKEYEFIHGYGQPRL